MAPMMFFEHLNMVQLGKDFFQLIRKAMCTSSEMLETICVIRGTVLSILLAIPFGILSAENLMPSCDISNSPTDGFCHAINEMVFVMLFVVVVGLGPFAGVMALFIHTTGVLAKSVC